MPAIVIYLGDTLGLTPPTAALRALTLKVVCDANDVIDEITLDGGREMWTAERWRDFVPHPRGWLSLWEETGRRNDLKADRGFLLDGAGPGVADIVTATPWSTLSDRFDAIGEIIKDAAPLTAALTQRVAALPPLAGLAAQARRDHGDAYRGGQIEASLRKVLDG